MILTPSALKASIYHELFLRSSRFPTSPFSAILGIRSAFPTPYSFSPTPVSTLTTRSAMAPLSTTDKRADHEQKNEQEVVPRQLQRMVRKALSRGEQRKAEQILQAKTWRSKQTNQLSRQHFRNRSTRTNSNREPAEVTSYNQPQTMASTLYPTVSSHYRMHQHWRDSTSAPMAAAAPQRSGGGSNCTDHGRRLRAEARRPGVALGRAGARRHKECAVEKHITF